MGQNDLVQCAKPSTKLLVKHAHTKPMHRQKKELFENEIEEEAEWWKKVYNIENDVIQNWHTKVYNIKNYVIENCHKTV